MELDFSASIETKIARSLLDIQHEGAFQPTFDKKKDGYTDGAKDST